MIHASKALAATRAAVIDKVWARIIERTQAGRTSACLELCWLKIPGVYEQVLQSLRDEGYKVIEGQYDLVVQWNTVEPTSDPTIP